VSPEPETEDLIRAIRKSRRAGLVGVPVSSKSAPRATQSNRTELLDRPSIAVLPFTNLSGDREQQYFADGVTEDIITELSRYRWLFVIARNSCFQFRGNVDVAEVRGALGVRYVVEGSVRKAGNRIRVTAQLNDAMDRSQIWAERYDRDHQDIFAVQDDVTGAIVATLESRVAAKGARTEPTWMASSRVGTRTSAWTARTPGLMRSTSGRTNASVLPDPVRAWPITSCPSRSAGMARAWIGVGRSRPCASRARCRVGCKSKWANDVAPGCVVI